MKPFAWSFSALSTFESCPKKYWHLTVRKDFKDEDSEASKDGKFIHDALHKRVINGKPLPLPMRNLEPLAARFASASGEMHGEMRLALNGKMAPVAFFAEDAWVRAIVDLLIVQDKRAIIVDWKTGKPKKDFTQMGLCSAVLARWMPEIEEFETLLVFTGHLKIERKTYSRADLVGVWNDLLPRVAKITEARDTTTFPAKESGLCGYCPVNTCPYWRERG